MSSTDRRLAPLEPAAMSEEVRALLGVTLDRVAALEGRAGAAESKPLNILRTLAHHPDLLAAFLPFATALAGGRLPRRESELLALRTAWNCGSPFEWGHHAVYARAAGLDGTEIARVPAGADAAGWSATDRLLLQAADELHAGQDLGDAVWRGLEAAYAPDQLLEIPFVVGQYTMLSMVANATGVPVEDGLPSLPRA